MDTHLGRKNLSLHRPRPQPASVVSLAAFIARDIYAWGSIAMAGWKPQVEEDICEK